LVEDKAICIMFYIHLLFPVPPPSSAEVKEWVELYLHSSNTPPRCGAQLKHRDNFTFAFYFGTCWPIFVSALLHFFRFVCYPSYSSFSLCDTLSFYAYITTILIVLLHMCSTSVSTVYLHFCRVYTHFLCVYLFLEKMNLTYLLFLHDSASQFLLRASVFSVSFFVCAKHFAVCLLYYFLRLFSLSLLFILLL
jgi:hypothetical protein